jgi:DNA topoisomerase-1
MPEPRSRKPTAKKPAPRKATAQGRGLVIVESPAKAKTIGGFLGKEFVVVASVGHVRDLPASPGEIPAHIKKEPWARLGVNIDNDFEPTYVVPKSRREQIRTLQRLLKGAPALWLATDEDREGEAISWHLVQLLSPRVPVHRLVFHEITEEAIHEALESPRQIDEDLVEAQETRRILDRLYGYEISPVLWRKIRSGLSAGRVQSVALRLLVDREAERIRFVAADWWDLQGTFRDAVAPGAPSFQARLVEVGGKRVATGKDFDPRTGRLASGEGASSGAVVVVDESRARDLCRRLDGRPARVLDVEEKPFTQRPFPPFTTSTLQQEAGRKLRYPARRTMGVAQRLYENGVITYMRTDSTALSNQAIEAARELIGRQFGARYLPPEPRVHKGQVKNAQEAHEAIRPAGHRFLPVEQVRREHGDEAGDLYELIWKRTVASQMPDAVGRRILVQVGVEDAVFRATGRVVEFDGFQRAYVEDHDPDDAEPEEGEAILPPLSKDQRLATGPVAAEGHRTQPPPRYTEASLVKELDRRGIGRPSTWASIIDVLLQREYAFKRGTALVPSFTAFAVVAMLRDEFGDLLDYEFTARMEDDLDAISRGEQDGKKYLRRFYLGNGSPGLHELVRTGIAKVDPRKVCGVALGKVGGRTIEVRVGRYGLFLTDGHHRAPLPEETVPDEMSLEKARELLTHAAKGPTPLGTDPASGKPVYLKSGRFGPYLQLGDVVEGEPKPKMASLLKGMDPKSVDLATALRLLALPRNLGPHPEDPEGKPVQALLGRYGPYVKWGTESRSIPPNISVLEITLAEAVALLKAPRLRAGRAAPAPIRELGKHPDTGVTLRIMEGRYGPYVTDGTLNASLPRGMDPSEVTVADAVALLRARAERMSSGPRRPRRKKPGSNGQ